MKRIIIAAVVILAAALPALSFAQTSEIKMLNTFDGRYPATPLVLDKFVETMKGASKGKFTFRASGPEVVPAPEQFQPVQKGAFDMLFTVQPWHNNVSSASMGIYALEPDPDGWRKNGLFDMAGNVWEWCADTYDPGAYVGRDASQVTLNPHVERRPGPARKA